MKKLLIALGIVLALWLAIEIGMRLSAPKTDFYSSINREQARELQDQFSLRTTAGDNWIHFGWVADPDKESYRVNWYDGKEWKMLAETKFGSALIYDHAGSFEVQAIEKSGNMRLIGAAEVAPTGQTPPVFKPVISGAWQPLFKPEQSGYYINDHTLFQDINGTWRLLGITSKTDGDFSAEKWLASAHADSLPPAGMMTEDNPIADYGELAWAPYVIRDPAAFHVFWSPHRLMQMTSADGITWQDPELTMPLPYHPHFRDPMVIEVAPGQWLLYTTARSFFYSRVDIYQSFDLKHWQYIRPAQVNAWGSEMNSSFASTESPFVAQYEGRYYLSVTFNNGSQFWHGLLLLMKVWIDPENYNDTRIFHSSNPYDFGEYRGARNTPNLIADLRTHAPEYIFNPDTGTWYVTTAGWPWVTTLTSGEVAIAPLEWQPIP